jgi:LEA14-like dessication related protein
VAKVKRVSIALSSFGFILAMSSCSLFVEHVVEKPDVNLRDVQVRDATVSGGTIVFDFNVHNPNPFQLQVDEVQYKIELAGKPFGAGQLKEPALIPGHRDGVVSVTLPFKYSDLFSSVLWFIAQTKSQYRIYGEARLGVIRIPFDQKGEFKIRD